MSHRADALNDIFENDILVRGTCTGGRLVALNGATGSFTAASGETITVESGIITFITSSTFLILLETGDKILMENGDNIENG